MSNSDSFIDEVTEEVRRDRVFVLMRRYGWIAVLVVLLVVGGSAYNEWRKAQAEAAARSLGDRILTALETSDPAARVLALQEIASESARAQALVDMIAAAEQTRQEAIFDAADTLGTVAQAGELPQLYRDLAVLKRVIALGPNMDPNDRAASLEALSQPGRAFRPLAVEQRALMHVDFGETEDAIGLFESLLEDAQATAELRQRARQMIIVLGGSLDAG